MHWHEFREKAYNGLYMARWYPRLYLPGCQPVLVFTPTKTSTSSLRNTLYRSGIGPVFWSHSMNREVNQREVERLARKGVKPPINRFWQDRVMERYVEAGQPLKIITSVREPVGRQVSGFFQGFEYIHGTSVNEYAGRVHELQLKFYDTLRSKFNYFSWFDEQFGDALGLDIYQHPFDHERGYQRLRHQGFDILVLRLETPDEVKEQALAEFLGKPRISLYRANVGSKKSYSEVYREFLDTLELPANYVDAQYNSRAMGHFYSEREIQAFRSNWATF